MTIPLDNYSDDGEEEYSRRGSSSECGAKGEKCSPPRVPQTTPEDKGEDYNLPFVRYAEIMASSTAWRG